LRAPVLVFDAGADRLLGHRFLLLIHKGRRSGLRHYAVLEGRSFGRRVARPS